MLKFLIPGYYLFYSRLKSTLEKISWFIIYVIPIFVIGLFYTTGDVELYTILFILALLAFNSVYELGYIENDIKTILKEKEPTIRLNNDDFKLLEERYFLIVFFKIVIVLGLLLLAKMVSWTYGIDSYIVQFIVILFVLRALFFMHNRIRNRGNIITFFLLAITKFSAPLFLLLPVEDLLPIWMSTLLLFPVLRTMEHATKEKYGIIGIQNFIRDKNLFRVKYYGFMLVVSSICYLFTFNPSVLLLVSLMLYFFFFRVGSYILVKKDYY